MRIQGRRLAASRGRRQRNLDQETERYASWRPFPSWAVRGLGHQGRDAWQSCWLVAGSPTSGHGLISMINNSYSPDGGAFFRGRQLSPIHSLIASRPGTAAVPFFLRSSSSFSSPPVSSSSSLLSTPSPHGQTSDRPGTNRAVRQQARQQPASAATSTKINQLLYASKPFNFFYFLFFFWREGIKS